MLLKDAAIKCLDEIKLHVFDKSALVIAEAVSRGGSSSIDRR
jgi:hypothetical protein